MEKRRHQRGGRLADTDDRDLARFDQRHVDIWELAFESQCREIARRTAADDHDASKSGSGRAPAVDPRGAVDRSRWRLDDRGRHEAVRDCLRCRRKRACRTLDTGIVDRLDALHRVAELRRDRLVGRLPAVRDGEVRGPVVAARVAVTTEANLQSAPLFRLEPELVSVRRDVLAIQRADNCGYALLEHLAVSTVGHGRVVVTTAGPGLYSASVFF